MAISKVTQLSLAILATFSVVACSAAEAESDEAAGAFSSDKAVPLDMDLDGELVTDRASNPAGEVRSQLLYSIGVLNGFNSVGRLDALDISILGVEAEGALQKVRYHVRMPVGWGTLRSTPATFDLALPRDVSASGLERFLRTYETTCIDKWSAHDVSTGNYWYYYRTNVAGCRPSDADVTRIRATVTKGVSSNGSYPEYDKIWADGELNAIVIFGKDRAGSRSSSDFGINAYATFNGLLGGRMPPIDAHIGVKLTANIPGLPAVPGVDTPELTWTGVYPDGRRLNITAMLVDSPRQATTAFDARYAQLTPKADLIIYNGHAALGDNVRALSRKGRFVTGQYTIVSMMGCDSFAYVDGYMAQERARLNSDDPNGTKYLDMITNVTPANPTWLPTAATKLIRALGEVGRPSTYAQITREWEVQHRAVVTGDEDNTYRPAAR